MLSSSKSLMNKLKSNFTTRRSPRFETNQNLSHAPTFNLLTPTPPLEKNNKGSNEVPIVISSTKRRLVESPSVEASDSVLVVETHKKSRKNFLSSGRKRKQRFVEKSDSEYVEVDHKGKAKVDEVNLDSDFADEISNRSEKSVKKAENSATKKAKSKMGLKKSNFKKRQAVRKPKKRYTYWKSYINVDVFDQLRERLNDYQFQLFKESPFGYFLDIPRIK